MVNSKILIYESQSSVKYVRDVTDQVVEVLKSGYVNLFIFQNNMQK